jgi:hypothetical protein
MLDIRLAGSALDARVLLGRELVGTRQQIRIGGGARHAGALDEFSDLLPRGFFRVNIRHMRRAGRDLHLRQAFG